MEALFSIGLASVVVVGMMTYFGSTLQFFVQQEDTLTGSRDAQLLASFLRDDLVALDGFDSSQTATTGTSFPKSWMHLVQTLESDKVQPFIHTSPKPPVIDPGEDPIVDPMPEPARTAAWLNCLQVGPDHPLQDHFPPSAATNRLLRSVNYARNAAAWVRPDDDGAPRYLLLNKREGPALVPVTYAYFPKQRVLRREDPRGSRELGRGMLEDFYVTPCFEFLLPDDAPGTLPLLVKVFYEVSFSLQADPDGGRITKRTLSFATKLTPRYLNAVLKSEWTR